MVAFVKAPRTRAFNIRKTKDGDKINVPGSDGTHKQPGERYCMDKGPGSVFLPQFSEAPEEAAGPVIPIRICSHCGYEIRTWILGDLTCSGAKMTSRAVRVRLHPFITGYQTYTALPLSRFEANSPCPVRVTTDIVTDELVIRY